MVVKGAADVATVESGSYWRLIMPGLPAFVLLAAAIPLLVPTLPRRLGERLAPRPARRPGLRASVAFVAFTAIVPIAVILLSDQSRAVPNEEGPPPVASSLVVVDDIGVPADGDVARLEVRRSARGNVLTWTDSTSRARTFYKVYRASAAFPDLVCEPRGVDRCELRAETLVTTREQEFVDPAPPPDATYRIGVAANWLDDENEGDVFALSPPAAPRPAG